MRFSSRSTAFSADLARDFESLEKWAKQKNLLWTGRAQLLAMPTVKAKIDKEVGEQLERLASHERPKKIGLPEHDFTIERGELTPKLSVKRQVVDKRYKSMIGSLYEEDAGKGGRADRHRPHRRHASCTSSLGSRAHSGVFHA